MKPKTYYLPLFLLCFLFNATQAFAQQSQAFLVDISPCMNIASAIERITCYDALATEAASVIINKPSNSSLTTDSTDRQLTQGLTPTNNNSSFDNSDDDEKVANSASSSMTQTTNENFGFAEEGIEDEVKEELIANVTELKETIPGRYLITLENGQVWRQMRSKRYRLRADDEVKIYPTKWGLSYRLTSARLGSFIQVERVR